MSESIVSQLATARKLFAEVSTDDSKVISDYGWTFVKALLQNLSDIDSVTARQLLADCIKLPMERPSKFHSALLAAVPSSSEEVKNILREIRITTINKDKGYAAWELVNKDEPITELLSPLQLSQGETSPSFTTGFLNLSTAPQASALTKGAITDAYPSCAVATVPEATASGFPIPFRKGWEGPALIFLKRGKDKQKRPFVAKILVNDGSVN